MGNTCEQRRLDTGKCAYWDEDNPEENFSLPSGCDDDGCCNAEDADFPGDVCEDYQADLAGDYCDRCGEYLGYGEEGSDEYEPSECACE